MRVLILGGGGMLGHKVWQVFRERFDTYVTVRRDYANYAKYGIFDPTRMRTRVDVQDFSTFAQTFEELRPDVVINCIGVIKQRSSANDPLISIEINSLFPHRIAKLCHAIGAHLVHMSTDCVFSGRSGMYTEEELPEPIDLYDRTKLLGEVTGPGCLTLRTSVIGRELETVNGLVEWFLSNQGQRVQGYTNAIYSGFPTLVLAQIIADLIEYHPKLSGLYHVSSEPISKYNLLCLLREAYRVSLDIDPFPDVCVDRSLDSSSFRAATGFAPSPWPEMVLALATDTTPYEAWKQTRIA